MKTFRILVVLIFALLTVSVIGCGRSDGLSAFKEKNKTNVAKVSTCFKIYGSRNGPQAPQDKDELVAFLKTPRVAKNLERLEIDAENLESIFISQRDGQPLKTKWGGNIYPEMAMNMKTSGMASTNPSG